MACTLTAVPRSWLMRCELGVALHTRGVLRLLERMVEERAIDVEHDAPIHGDETAIAVVRETVVAGDPSKALHTLVVETEVQHRVHHSGHRKLGARTNRHQQWIGGVAKLATHRSLEFGDLRRDLSVETLRPAGLHVCPAGVGTDREPRRYRQLQHAGHLCQVGALPSQQVFVLHRRAAVFVAECEDEWHRTRVYGAAVPRHL